MGFVLTPGLGPQNSAGTIGEVSKGQRFCDCGDVEFRWFPVLVFAGFISEFCGVLSGFCGLNLGSHTNIVQQEHNKRPWQPCKFPIGS